MITLCIITFIVLTNMRTEVHSKHVSYEKPMNFTELAKTLGFIAEEYEVKTADGYILGLFRIPGKRGLPILLTHGLLDTSDTWLLRGRESLGFTLANKGYDVWFGNVRGNKYSRRHVYLNPDRDVSFWDFTVDEHGSLDLPVIIDTVLNTTGAPQLYAFGHSQGNAIYFVLGSTRPEYNAKVKVMTALAPVFYLHHIPPPLSLVIKIAPELNSYVRSMGVNEVFRNTSKTRRIAEFICNKPLIKYKVCALGVLFPISGFDITELEPKFYDIAVKHFPDRTSWKNVYHFAQTSLQKNFTKYDYGSPYLNFKRYGSCKPPYYDPKKVTMPVVLLEGRNDKLSVVADVELLKPQLPNLLNYTIIKWKLMSHFDFIWGKHMDDYLFPCIFHVLEGNN